MVTVAFKPSFRGLQLEADRTGRRSVIWLFRRQASTAPLRGWFRLVRCHVRSELEGAIHSVDTQGIFAHSRTGSKGDAADRQNAAFNASTIGDATSEIFITDTLGNRVARSFSLRTVLLAGQEKEFGDGAGLKADCSSIYCIASPDLKACAAGVDLDNRRIRGRHTGKRDSIAVTANAKQTALSLASAWSTRGPSWLTGRKTSVLERGGMHCGRRSRAKFAGRTVQAGPARTRPALKARFADGFCLDRDQTC